MVNLKNNGSQRLHFQTAGEKTFLDPGETAKLDIRNENDPQYQGRLAANLISIVDEKPKKSSAQKSSGNAATANTEPKSGT